MRLFSKLGILILTVVLLAMPLLAACGDGEKDKATTPAQTTSEPLTPATTQPPSPTTPAKNTVIKLGYLTDLTGPASAAMTDINTAMDDAVRYYNEEKLIPGVELEIVKYDTQWDPSKDISGYEWVRSKGAGVIFSIATSACTSLKPSIERDGTIMFSASGNKEIAATPGRIFQLGNSYTDYAYTYLAWVAEHDWDYEAKGPAKIGMAIWEDASFAEFADAMRGYVNAHPDQFEIVGIYLEPFTTMMWDSQVNALKDCDYVIPNSFPLTFVKQYRDVGGRGKFLFLDGALTTLGMLRDARLLDKIDGTIAMRSPIKWWNEEGELVDLVKEILHRYHPDTADQIMASGNSYQSIVSWLIGLKIIESAAESAGAANVDSEAIYEAAKSFQWTVEGYPYYSFGEAKRTAPDYLRVYRFDAEVGDLVSLSDDPIPAVHAP